MNSKQLPQSGYVIDKIYSPSQSLAPETPSSEGPSAIDFGWDWRLLDEPKDRFEVKVTVTVHPTEKRHEKLSATVVGLFRSTTEQPTVDLSNFVRYHAPAILLPYVRQVLSGLTNLSYFGAFYLPAINIAKLMEDFDASNSFGAKQLLERKPQNSLVSAANEPRAEKRAGAGKKRPPK